MADANQGPIGPSAHLAPELRSLPAEARAIWGDPDERRRALEAILDAWERRVPVLDATIRRVDDAVVAGLAALGFPRGEVRAIELDVFGRGWAGRKRPDCTLLLDAGVLRGVVEPDTAFKTWVHESLHARQPYSPLSGFEASSWSGYEEGLVEGLAQRFTRDLAAMRVSSVSYDAFVTAYRALGAAAEFDIHDLWEELWKYRTGEVRATFPAVVDLLRRQGGQGALSEAQRVRLRLVGDRLFESRRGQDRHDWGVMTALWRSVFS